MDFFGGVQKAAEALRSLKELDKKVIRVVGNLDTDGISATSIIIQAFRRENLKFSASIVKQLDEATLKMLEKEKHEVIFFLDLGSGAINSIIKVLPNKKVFILDHHYPEQVEHGENIVHVNPHFYGLSGTKDVSAAGVAYFFAKALSEKNVDLSYLALLGAVGDVQENNGFFGLNDTILKDAVKSGKIRVEEGLRIYGITTKPLHKVLEYSTNPYIPGVSGSEEGAVKFLKEIGINFRDGLTYRRYSDLSKEETKKFISAVMMNKVNPEEVKMESVYGNVYFIEGEDEDMPTKELHEFSTLLNCCGRLGKSSLGIGTCLNDNELKEKAVHLLHEYRNEITAALQWFYRNKNNKNVIELNGVTIINAEDSVNDTIIGTLTSLISKSLVYREGTVVIGMARTMSDETKISLRISGFGEGKVNLRTLVHEILGKVGGTGGGHSLAAGAVIPKEQEEAFISAITEHFKQILVEA